MPASRSRSPQAIALSLALTLVMVAGMAAFRRPVASHPTQSEAPDTLAAYVVSGTPNTSFGATRTGPIAVEGRIVTADGEAPVAGATVIVGEQKVATSDADGHFTITDSALTVKPGAGGPLKLNFEVVARGFASWSLTGARYYADDILRIYPKLQPEGHAPVELSAAPDNSMATKAAGAGSPDAEGLTPPSANGKTSTGATSPSTVLPATIRVYRTGSRTVEIVPFRDYVKHVLPNEWIPTWGAESLKAGAMAVKSYAWFWINRGGKQSALGADVKDNVEDQVYDPNVSYASTDAAVDSTFNYSITLNGNLFQAQYCAGSYSGNPGGDCPWSGLYMTQWGSAFHADHGRTWGWILQFYYTGAVISPNPPGGGYNGPPPSQATPTAAPPAPATPLPPAGGNYTVGQGSDRADLYQEAYARNGGAAMLGVPVGPARWWLTYVSEFNVQAQRFSGADGRNNVWIVYDILKASTQGVRKAFVMAGAIGLEYASHTPPGPEWLGPPTSDPYTSAASAGGYLSQGFANGTLAATGAGVRFTPWPTVFNGWKAEYFTGHDPASPTNGAPYSLGGQPALISDVPAPAFDWTATPDLARQRGVGTADWSVQYSKEVTLQPGSYSFQVTANGGVRLWLDGMLAINSWIDRRNAEYFTYDADLADGPHRVRIQYYSAGGSASLAFNVVSASSQPAPTSVAPPSTASARVLVRWLGRGAAPSDRWVLPLRLQLSIPGNPAVVATYNSTTDRNGVALFNGLPGGIYDLHVKGPHSVQSAKAAIDLRTGSSVDVDMKAQVEGDVDGDNCVTPEDLSRVQTMLGASRGTPGFSASADLDGDGSVTMSDMSLLRSGFDRCGDISADNEFRAMSTNQGPTLAQSLAPWLNPSQMQHNLQLMISSSQAQAKSGDVIKVTVMAQTGAQPVDGAAFVLHYDPQRFAPIDANRNPAVGADPGLMLPAVMGNWIDAKGGAVGYSCATVQGNPPAGRFTLATLLFQVLPGGTGRPVQFNFSALPSPHVQLTNGGENLLATTQGTSVTVNP